MEEERVFYNERGERVPYRYSKEVKESDRERAEKKWQEKLANREAREKQWAEEERQRKIQEAIPKMTPKRVAEIARDKHMWLHDPKTREWWTPEQYQDKFERLAIGYEEYVAGVEMRDPIEAMNESFELLEGDIEFMERKTLLKKFKRFREFVGRVVGYYRG